MNARKFASLAKKLNADIVLRQENQWLYLSVYAPDGKVWVDGLCPVICEGSMGGYAGARDDIRAEAAERMLLGLDNEEQMPKVIHLCHTKHAQ